MGFIDGAVNQHDIYGIGSNCIKIEGDSIGWR